jgi:hypothetical protein
MSSGFAGAHEPQPLKQIDRATESDYLQAERLARCRGILLQSTHEQRAQALIAKFGKQGEVDTTDFGLARIDQQPAGAFTRQENHPVSSLPVIVIVKRALGFVLHLQELVNASFIPAKFTQVRATTTLIDLKQEGRIISRYRA